MTETALADLNIITWQEHPSLMIQNMQPKEGFSLFNLFDFTLLMKGKAYLKYLFSTPLKNLRMILDRQNSIYVLAVTDK